MLPMSRLIKYCWLVGTSLYVINAVLYTVTYAIPFMYKVHPNTRIGLFQVCGIASGKCVDIGDYHSYGLMATHWRDSETLTSAGLSLVLFGGVLWQYLLVIDYVMILPFIVLLTIAGNAVGFSGVVIFLENGRQVFASRFAVVPIWGSITFIIACLCGAVSGFLLFIVSVATIQTYQSSRSTKKQPEFWKDASKHEDKEILKVKL